MVVTALLIVWLVVTHHSISISGSKLTWDDVDRYAKSVGFKERSKFVQYCLEKEIYKSKIRFKDILVIINLLLMAMIMIVLLLRG